MRHLGWLGALAVLLVACGSGTIEGSGTVRDETRPIPVFDQIEVYRGVNVQISVVPGAAPEVIVHYDDNVLGRITTEVDGSTLEIRLNGNVRLRSGTVRRFVEVIVPRLVRIEAREGARVVGIGQVDALVVRAAEGASLDLGSLQAGEISVDVSGGANTTVNTTGNVRGDASGGARLLVVGEPTDVDVATSGGASVAEG